MFAASVLSMWSTDSSRKNRIIFGPPQRPCKQNQNKSVSWHKKPAMSQIEKKTLEPPSPFTENR
jgi:hypothetical protein